MIIFELILTTYIANNCLINFLFNLTYRFAGKSKIDTGHNQYILFDATAAAKDVSLNCCFLCQLFFSSLLVIHPGFSNSSIRNQRKTCDNEGKYILNVCFGIPVLLFLIIVNSADYNRNFFVPNLAFPSTLNLSKALLFPKIQFPLTKKFPKISQFSIRASSDGQFSQAILWIKR